jgi:hypothetical protein
MFTVKRPLEAERLLPAPKPETYFQPSPLRVDIDAACRL